MPKAVLRDGVIHPLEPLLPEWTDGRELVVEEARQPKFSPDAITAWAEELNALCADSDLEEEARMQAAIDEHRREAKARTRRQMGLSGGVPAAHSRKSI